MCYNGSCVVRLITVPIWILLCIIFSPLILAIYIHLIFKLNKDNFICDGIKVHTYVYEYKDKYGRTVILIPMIHISSSEFYESVNNILNGADVILAEGVNDRKRILDKPINYGFLTSLTGLEPQKSFDYLFVVNGDGDISDLSEDTIKVIKSVTEMSHGECSFREFRKIQKNVNIDDILHTRNFVLLRSFNSLLSNQRYIKEKLTLDSKHNKPSKHVNYNNMFETLDDFQQVMPREQVIVIPWGAKHLPYFQEMVDTKNFKLTSTKKLYVFNLTSLFFNILLYPIRNK